MSETTPKGDGPWNGDGVWHGEHDWEHWDDLENLVVKEAIDACAVPLGLWCFLRWVLECVPIRRRSPGSRS